MPPKRIKRYTGRYATVDGIPYVMPIQARDSPAFIAGFSCDWQKANDLLPGNEVHALKLPNGRAVLLITVIDYVDTSIGKYIEFSIAIGCTRSQKPAPPILNMLLAGAYGTGQYILDLPVSTEISVKGGKGIWGMPKHQANLSFEETPTHVSSQYEKDGRFAFRIEIKKPKSPAFNVGVGTVNYCQFRNMLIASKIYFQTKASLNLFGSAQGSLFIGDHPRVAMLRDIDINPDPLVTAFMPAANGILDDHMKSWFLTYDEPPRNTGEDMNDVALMGLGEEWLPPPAITDFERYRLR